MIKLFVHVMALLAFSLPVCAQGSNMLSEHQDWAFYADNGLCWASTQPDLSLSEYVRNGKSIDTPDRGDKKFIALAVVFQKGKSSNPQLMYSAGNFEFSESASNSKLFKIVIRGSNFKNKSYFLAPYNVEGMGWAYAYEEQEADAINLLKKGANASVTVVSKRGTVITDTLSLIGISEAIGVAMKKCSES